jgi:hypothetical protein
LTIAASERRLRTERQLGAAMRPLYDAQIEDLGPGDFLKVECACGHDLLIPLGLLQWRLPPSMRVLDLERRSGAENAISAARWCCRSSGPTDK